MSKQTLLPCWLRTLKLELAAICGDSCAEIFDGLPAWYLSVQWQQQVSGAGHIAAKQ